MFTGGKHIVNTYNLLVVVFVALGTLSTAYGLAIIGSTVGQPNCTDYFIPLSRHQCELTVVQSIHTSISHHKERQAMHTQRTSSAVWSAHGRAEDTAMLILRPSQHSTESTPLVPSSAV